MTSDPSTTLPTDGTDSGPSTTDPTTEEPTTGSSSDTDATSSSASETDSDTGTETATDTEGETEYPNDDSPLGMNISPVRDWVPQWMFVDGFVQARAWIPQEVDSNVWDTGLPIALDSDGWVASLTQNQAAATLLYTTGYYPAGEYTVRYAGSGTLEFRW
ncbi:MAG: hypothetical protein ACPG77_13350, partial [Nannocystaceae bacterium]